MLCKKGENEWEFAAGSITGAQERSKYILLLLLQTLCSYILSLSCNKISFNSFAVEFAMMHAAVAASFHGTHNNVNLLVWFSHVCVCVSLSQYTKHLPASGH
jgi:hypothetical protein